MAKEKVILAYSGGLDKQQLFPGLKKTSIMKLYVYVLTVARKKNLTALKKEQRAVVQASSIFSML